MINFPGFNRNVVNTTKNDRLLTTQSAAIYKDNTQPKTDRRRARERRKQTKVFRGLERRCGDRRSGRIQISV